jgi:signal transduction histidine kinase
VTIRNPAEPDEPIRAARMDAASRMSRVLAHEIANYLGSIRTMLYLLADELGPDPKAKEDLQVLGRTVDGAMKLVEALRGFAHAQPLGVGPADLNAVLLDTEPALRALMPPGKTLKVDLANEPLAVLADAPRLAQLALDLVAGANHTLPVGGRIDVSTARAPGPDGGAPTAALVVRDDGPGLEQEAAARIFEPFVFDIAHDTGLRLPTIYATVTRSGGAITAESAPGAGTAIRVTLPLAPAQPPTAAR